MSWNIKKALIEARHNLPLNQEEIIQGAINTDQNALQVELVGNSSATAATFSSNSKTNQTPGTAVRLCAERGLITAHKFDFVAYRPSRADNSSTVWLGVASGSGQQYVPIDPRQSFPLEAPPGKVIDLYDVYIDVAVADDGLVWIGSK